MKTLIYGLLAAATLVPGAAMAQTSRGELARDREDIREERRDLDRAYRYGDRDDIRDEREDYREAREEYREDLRDRRDDRGHGYDRGHRYAPVYAGHRLHARYYAPRYYVARPWEYRLPRAHGPFRWVRYGNDFLLVNVRNGHVRDVVRSRYSWRR